MSRFGSWPIYHWQYNCVSKEAEGGTKRVTINNLISLSKMKRGYVPDIDVEDPTHLKEDTEEDLGIKPCTRPCGNGRRGKGFS